MLEFREINISDKTWATELLKISDFRGCEYTFANNMAWRRLNNSQIARYKDFYICGCPLAETPYFTFPSGEGNYKEVIGELREYSHSKGKPLILSGLTNDTLKIIESLYPNEYTVTFNDSNSDYIYLTEDLAELKGKKYHQKRGHLKKFYQKYNWTFSPITPADYDECIAFSAVTYNEKHGYDDASSIAEQFAIHTYFSYFKELGLIGGVLRVDGEIVAFTIGEPLNSDTFCVHIEKSNTDYDGSFPAINNEFVKYAMKDFKYINREEDMGIEGLRKAKRSYNPVFMLDKYIVKFK